MYVSFTLARGSHELGSMNLCRMLQNAAGSEEVIEHGGEKNTFSSKGGKGGLTSLLLA